jgi:hypothetical protein
VSLNPAESFTLAIPDRPLGSPDAETLRRPVVTGAEALEQPAL